MFNLSMKARIYSIFFLAVLISYVLRPVMPFIEYALNKDYIAKNLCINRNKPKSCCQGKCHLKKQLAKSDESNDTAKNQSSQKQQRTQIDEFLKIQLCIKDDFDAIAQGYPVFIQPQVPVRFTSAIFVPPQPQFDTLI